MDETDNAVEMSEEAAGGESENDGGVVNCDETEDALLLESEETANNLENNLNNDTVAVDVANNHNLSAEDELNPVTANNLSDDLEHVSLSPPTRYLQVEGFDGRRNDLVYCRPLTASATSNNASNSSLESDVDVDAHTSGVEEKRPKLMLFFGGDIQDFPEMMEQHRDHRNYVSFNLEATALMLQKQFPEHHIAVVRPSRIQMLTFSCYDNFVHCNHTGAPEHVITHHSLHHLELLIQNLSKRIAKGESETLKNELNDGSPIKKLLGNDEDATVSSTTVDESSSTTANHRSSTSSSNKPSVNVRLDRASISLVGFSKGCVVLNQLLYEFHYLKTLTPDDLSMDEFLTCIKDMYWLDGGHNGGKNTWITSRSLLETLTRLGVGIHVHLTPYQLLDDRRPWIRKEEKLFSELLKKFSAPIIRRIHFDTEPASLLQHLRIIGHFASDDSKSMDEPSSIENNMEH